MALVYVQTVLYGVENVHNLYIQQNIRTLLQ